MITLLAIIGAVLVYGSVGALECGTIGFPQFFTQLTIGVLCLIITYLLTIRKNR